MAIDNSNNLFVFGGFGPYDSSATFADLWRMNEFLRCPAGRYKASPAEDVCSTCPYPSVSKSSFTAGIAACYCPAGYAGSSGTCQQCAPGYYSAAGQTSCTPCPAGRYGGSYGLTTSSCTDECPAGSYCPEGAAGPIPCSPGRYGAVSVLSTPDCSGVCDAGHYCPASSTNSRQHACPAGAHSDAGAGSIHDCYCRAGYAAPVGEDCQICPAGRWAAANMTECALCPAGRFGSESGLGSSSCTALCQPGYYCPAGSTSETEFPCPENSISTVGAGNISDCLCLPGYTGATMCRICPEGTYKATAGPESCIPCGPGMYTPAGATSLSQCHCLPGYSPIEGGEGCEDIDECTAGMHNCPDFGNGTMSEHSGLLYLRTIADGRWYHNCQRCKLQEWHQ